MVLFKLVNGLNTGDTAGYIEQWYFGGSQSWEGIRVKNRELLKYAGIVSRGQGFCLGKKYFFGMGLQDCLYHNMSSLVNGVLLTESIRKEFVEKDHPRRQKIKRDDDQEETSKIMVGKSMPEMILTILAETQEKIKETAKLLKLPLEEVVMPDS
ncbi:hypothetical protein ES703_95222 [subsurface metagenome]